MIDNHLCQKNNFFTPNLEIFSPNSNPIFLEDSLFTVLSSVLILDNDASVTPLVSSINCKYIFLLDLYKETLGLSLVPDILFHFQGAF